MTDSKDIDIVKTYLKDMSKYSQLTIQEERELYKKYKSGDMSAREQLIVRNWRLVVAVANKYKNSGIEFLDLVSQGNLGLIRGLQNYDETRGTRIATYCTYWIRQSISRAIMQKTRNIKIPVYISEYLHKIRAFQQQNQMNFGKTPSNQEIADHFGISLFVVEQALKYYQDTLSLDAPLLSEDSDESDSFIDTIQDEAAADPINHAILSNRSQVLNNILETLRPKERDIIKMHFGIGSTPMTFEQIGHKMGFSKERACQIEKEALFKLRNPLRTSFLVDFV